MKADKLREELTAAASEYRSIDAARTKARDRAVLAVVEALRGGITPTEVTKLGPFSPAYIRIIARNAGIPPGKKGSDYSQA